MHLLLLGLLMVFSLQLGASTMMPNAPVYDFKIPFFCTAGDKTWELLGSKGIYLEDQLIEVEILGINTFENGDYDRVIMSIESPSARINTRDRLADSTDDIYVESEYYSITGKGWSWDGSKRVTKISQNVHVVFHDSAFQK